MIRVLLTTAAAMFVIGAYSDYAAAASAQSTAGQSYRSRTYQENSSANRQSQGASRAFAPVTNSNKKK